MRKAVLGVYAQYVDQIAVAIHRAVSNDADGVPIQEPGQQNAAGYAAAWGCITGNPRVCPYACDGQGNAGIQTESFRVAPPPVCGTDGNVADVNVTGSGRYVRFCGTARGTSYGCSRHEFGVYQPQVVKPLEVSHPHDEASEESAATYGHLTRAPIPSTGATSNGQTPCAPTRLC